MLPLPPDVRHNSQRLTVHVLLLSPYCPAPQDFQGKSWLEAAVQVRCQPAAAAVLLWQGRFQAVPREPASNASVHVASELHCSHPVTCC